MQKVIDGLLTLARADTGRLTAQLAAVNLADLLEQTVPSLTPLAEERSQLLDWVCDQPIQVLADEALLRQMLLNLVHNSINHCGPGTRITVKVSETHTDATISIIDNGPGMETGAQDEVFRRKGTTHASVRGLGLGLSIAKALAGAQGASLQIDSEPGLGTRVHIQMTRAAVSGRGSPDAMLGGKPGQPPAPPASG